MQNTFRLKKVSCAMVILCVASLLPLVLEAQEKSPPAAKAAVKLAVLPFQAVMPEEGSSTVRCPVCGSVNSGGSIVKGAEKIVEELFTDKLSGLKDTEIISSERAAGVYRRIAADSLKKPLQEIIIKAGNELRADVLVTGFVYHYRERVGYDYSAEHPAWVAFEIHLISIKDGSTLWRGIFDKKQKSLMEDVFQASSFFRGGGKWLTARELTKLGIDEIFATFPDLELN